jgi:predicted lipoprotein with Yx(FWY)xxD motif
MSGSDTGQAQVPRSHRRHAPGLSIGVVIAVLALAGSLTALALATGTGRVVQAAQNAKLGERIVVDAQGRTVYALSPETRNHLLCKSSECLAVWPPLTVSSRKAKLAGAGVQGHLGILRRANGRLQVTLRGMPLYLYAGDSAKGQANGQGKKSFGGTWHVLSAANAQGDTPATPAPGATSGGAGESGGGGYSEPAAGGGPASTPSSPGSTTPAATPPATTPGSTPGTGTTPSYPKEETHESPKGESSPGSGKEEPKSGGSW